MAYVFPRCCEVAPTISSEKAVISSWAVIGVAVAAGSDGADGGVVSSGGVLGAVELVEDGVVVVGGVPLAGLLDEKNLPSVAKASPPTVNIITIRITRPMIKDEELFFGGMAPR